MRCTSHHYYTYYHYSNGDVKRDAPTIFEHNMISIAQNCRGRSRMKMELQ